VLESSATANGKYVVNVIILDGTWPQGMISFSLLLSYTSFSLIPSEAYGA
jgi:hypothetical protein